jgi:hypothetical protein
VQRCRFFVRAVARLAIALIAWLAADEALATTVLYQTDAQLVGLSDRVAHVRVLDVHAEVDPNGQTIHTIAHLAVLEDFTGINESIIEVRELGGDVGTARMWIPGAVTYIPGDELVICLKQHNGTWRALAQ